MKRLMIVAVAGFVLAGMTQQVAACGPAKCGYKNKKSSVIKTSEVDKKVNKEEGTILLVSVSGMTCEGCEDKIETSLMSQDGVNSVVANQEKGSVTIYYDNDQINQDKIVDELEKLDYTLVSVSS